MKRENIDIKIKRLKDLPTLPTILVECNKLLEDPNVSASQLANIIKSDQAVSSKVLKLVNSAFYGLSGKVGTICQGIVVLGFNTVRNLILSLSALDLLPKDADLGEFEISDLWKHSLGCAIISRVFAQRIGIKDPEEAFIAGLLHDIGKIITAKLFREEFVTILKTTHKEKKLFLDVEQGVLGTAHDQIGGMLAKNWQLPSTLSESISFHHNGEKTMKHAKLVYTIRLADIVTRGLQIGSGGDRVIPEMDKTAWDTLKVSYSDIARWVDDLDEEFDKASAFFSVLSG